MLDQFGDATDEKNSLFPVQDETFSDPPYEPPGEEEYSSSESNEDLEAPNEEQLAELNQEGFENFNVQDASQIARVEGGAEYDDEYSDSDVEIVLDSIEDPSQAIQPRHQMYASTTAPPPSKPLLKRKASFIKIIDSPSHTTPPVAPYPREDGTLSPPPQPPEIAAITAVDFEAQNKPEENYVYNINLDEIPDTPWRKPGVDITDYFNYGFNEQTWKEYASKIKLLGEYNTHIEIQNTLEQQLERNNVRLAVSEHECTPLQNTAINQAKKWDVDNENETGLCDLREGCQPSWSYEQQAKGDNIPPGSGIYRVTQPNTTPFCDGQQVMHNISTPPFLNAAPPIGIDRQAGVMFPPSVYKSRHFNAQQAYRHLKPFSQK